MASISACQDQRWRVFYYERDYGGKAGHDILITSSSDVSITYLKYFAS